MPGKLTARVSLRVKNKKEEVRVFCLFQILRRIEFVTSFFLTVCVPCPRLDTPSIYSVVGGSFEPAALILHSDIRCFFRGGHDPTMPSTCETHHQLVLSLSCTLSSDLLSQRGGGASLLISLASVIVMSVSAECTRGWFAPGAVEVDGPVCPVLKHQTEQCMYCDRIARVGACAAGVARFIKHVYDTILCAISV